MKRVSLIIFSIALLMQIMCLQQGHSAVLLDRIVAIVNNEVITWSELRSTISREAKSFLEKVPEGKKDEAMKELEKDFLNTLIDMKLQLQEARQRGLDLNKSEIDSAISDIKKKYNLTDEALLHSLEAEGMTFEEYRTRLGEQIMVSKLVNFEVKTNIVISDREIAEYYEADKDRFGSIEKLRIRQIFFAAPKDQSKRSIMEASAREVIARLDKGEEFSNLAGELSEDASRKFGGDLGYISRGSVLKEVEDAAFTLKIGEVSKPFWSPFGLHIIKLEERIEGEGFDKVKDKIKETLFEKAFESKYLEWKAGLKEKAYIEIKL
jgi:peptidyl-prolyl cis-trans isomerase SurA